MENCEKNGNYMKKYSEYYYLNERNVTLGILRFSPLG
jgi:hypothetical protein